MAEIDETELPGIGVRREFTTRAGMRLGVIATRTGGRDLLLYDRDDPDVCRSVVPLDESDSDVLSDLLGADRVKNDAASTLLNLEGLVIDWVGVDPGSDVAGTSIGDARLRTRTGATVAAIIDGDRSVPGPGPEEVLPPGAVVVAVGTKESVLRMEELLAHPST
ncbi:MAG: cation:proton antiporter regulatory subunit [Microthrixaceae bacterium]|nr:cation:proton antiporter regulatory subunit [Microthrixaceae bacterium]MCO5318370.1 cation:proton antiporter regulatory subunit [Microthrixaceae bacterium]